MRFGATFSEPYARSLGIYPAAGATILGANLYTRVWDRRHYVDIDLSASRYKGKIREVSSSVNDVMVAGFKRSPGGRGRLPN